MRLFIFGLGYTARALVKAHRSRFTWIGGTAQADDTVAALTAEGISARRLCDDVADGAIATDIAQAEAMLVSVPPSAQGDPVLARFRDAIACAPRLTWIGYLSTIGVYGDQRGAWVDEATPPAPSNRRSRERLAAEQAWLELGRQTGKAVHIFRLAGIYGPGRNALAQLAAGSAKRVVKPGQVFNRIHVDDIAAVLMAAMEKPRAGAVYNVADDEPAPSQDVIAFAAGLAGVEPPPEEPLDQANLSPMAASFYAESKRASNRRIKEELGVKLNFPTYREGLRALWEGRR